MKHKAYFQFRFAGDSRPWADIPVRFDSGVPIDAEAANHQALIALVQYQYLVEVRWHWEGSRQGHYVNREQSASSIRWLQSRKAIKPWQEAARAASEALETFYLQLERWWSFELVPEAEFQAALRALRQEGLEGWFDGSPLNIDRLHAVLVEGQWEEDSRPPAKHGGGQLADCVEDDAYMTAQAEEYGEGWGMSEYIQAT
ncbi:MAG TPA: hypothetical protein PKH77_05100 [Anaerolineae bacterium]|nr:hypothetical protein [Anaerolineae bacterium]